MNQIYEITKFTTTDYQDELACIVWFGGCNMRCIYCYNIDAVLNQGKITNDEFLNFLKSRVGKLSGVVFSGGECTLCRDFLTLCRNVKNLGYKLKVDTNGTNLDVIKQALDENLIDYIALDFKAYIDKFKEITKSNLYYKFEKTLQYLIKIDFKFEVRTTIHTDFINENDISQMAQYLENLGYKNNYYLQNFLQTNHNFTKLPPQKRVIDKNKILTKLNIVLRNF